MDWLNLLITLGGCGSVTAIVNFFCNQIAEKKKAKSAENVGTKLLLKDRLRWLCKEYIRQGWVYEDELEDLILMHEQYKKLGGNGFLNTLMDAVKRLEIKVDKGV